VSDLGRVRSLSRTIIDSLGRRKPIRAAVLRPSLLSTGYPAVKLPRGTKRVHALVMEAFVGPRSPDLFVLHRNGRKTDVRLSNLRYGTPKENNADSLRHGVIKFGSERASSKLTEERVRIIRGLDGAIPDTKVGAVFGVAGVTVGNVRRGEMWSRVRGGLARDEAMIQFRQLQRGQVLRATLPVLVGALSLCRQRVLERRR